MARPAVFLDRDGVIIENRATYVRTWDDVQVIPRALHALERLSRAPLAIVIVTNQSAIGRGIISPEAARALNERIVALVETAGGRIDAVFMCPHVPTDCCDCRKPKPGLLHTAATQLNLDLRRSFMVGDSLTDVESAVAVGAEPVLVLTGHGRRDQRKTAALGKRDLRVFADLDAATDFILSPGGLTRLSLTLDGKDNHTLHGATLNRRSQTNDADW